MLAGLEAGSSNAPEFLSRVTANLEGLAPPVAKHNLWILLQVLLSDGRGEFLRHLGLADRGNLILLNPFVFRKIDAPELVARIKELRRAGPPACTWRHYTRFWL